MLNLYMREITLLRFAQPRPGFIPVTRLFNQVFTLAISRDSQSSVLHGSMMFNGSLQLRETPFSSDFTSWDAGRLQPSEHQTSDTSPPCSAYAQLTSELRQVGSAEIVETRPGATKSHATGVERSWGLQLIPTDPSWNSDFPWRKSVAGWWVQKIRPRDQLWGRDSHELSSVGVAWQWFQRADRLTWPAIFRSKGGIGNRRFGARTWSGLWISRSYKHTAKP